MKKLIMPLIVFVLLTVCSIYLYSNNIGIAGRTLRDSNTGCGNIGCHGIRDTGNIYITPTITLNGIESFNVVRDSTYILSLNINNWAGGVGMKGYNISTLYGKLDTIGVQMFKGTTKINDYELVHSYPNNVTNSVLFKYTAPHDLVTDTIFATVNRGNPTLGHISRWNFMPNKPIVVNNPLAITLESFTFSIVNNNNVQLNWKTSYEINNSGFEIYRNNIKIGFVKSLNGNTPFTYSYFDQNLQPGIYLYKLRQMDYNGNGEEFRINPIEIKIPSKIILKQNYPNPFNTSTKIDFSLSKPKIVSLKVYDINGKEIFIIFNNIYYNEGYHSINYSSNLVSGIYFYKLYSSDFNIIKKMIIVK